MTPPVNLYAESVILAIIVRGDLLTLYRIALP